MISAQLHRLSRSHHRGRVPTEDRHRQRALSTRHPGHGRTGRIHGNARTGKKKIKKFGNINLCNQSLKRSILSK